MEKENLIVQLPAEDKQLFADYCQRHRVTMSDRIRELIKNDIEKEKGHAEVCRIIAGRGVLNDLDRFMDIMDRSNGIS